MTEQLADIRFELLQQKLPFPYEWFDSAQKLEEPIGTLLANPSLFASKLRGESWANESDMNACDEALEFLQQYNELQSQRPFFLPGVSAKAFLRRVQTGTPRLLILRGFTSPTFDGPHKRSGNGECGFITPLRSEMEPD